jgi:multidrug transporter EmrE-like cation transporter
MFAWKSIVYGLAMAFIDMVMMGLVKQISGGGTIMKMVLPMAIYSLEPWIFLSAMKSESMVIMNLIWDLVSNLLVTSLGVFYFGEKIGRIRTVGFVLSLVSLVLLSFTD